MVAADMAVAVVVDTVMAAAVAEEVEAMGVAIINSLINFQKIIIIIIRVNFIFFFLSININNFALFIIYFLFFLLFCRWLVSLSFFSLTFVLQHNLFSIHWSHY